MIDHNIADLAAKMLFIEAKSFLAIAAEVELRIESHCGLGSVTIKVSC